MKQRLADLRNQSVDELLDEITKLKKELMHFRFQQKTGKLEKHSALRDTKKDIARIFTVINEKSVEKKS